jgi:hypothetical protein
MQCCICLEIETNSELEECSSSYKICIPCTDSYINFCLNECLNEYQTLPKCPNTNKCQKEVFYKKRIPQELKDLYDQILFNYLERSPNLEIKLIIENLLLN